MRSLWTLQDWSRALAELPSAGPFRERVAIVPNGRVAHALRRELIESACGGSLIGARFLTLVQLAAEILQDADQACEPNDRELGPSLVREAFSSTTFERFDRADLETLPGWDIAFTRTIADLEAALISPEDCLASSDPHIRDVGRVHDALRMQSELVTVGTLLRRASKLAQSWDAQTPKLAVITGFESPAEMELLHALRNVTIAQWVVRPHRTAHATRMQALGGPAHADLGTRATPSQVAQNTLQCLQVRLFEDSESSAVQVDDSVTIALYAGVHEEVEAAATWVAYQILERRIAGQDIAILSPAPEPYGSLLRARLDALPWPQTSSITFSERGIPLAEAADGTRLLLVIHALRQGLSRDALAPVLPILRPTGDAWNIRGLSHAWELLNTVAVVGGERSNLDAGCAWPDAWRRARARLDAPLLKGGGLEEREQLRCSELQEALDSIAPAIEALARLLTTVIENHPLQALWARLLEFVSDHVRLPVSTPPATAILDGACKSFVGNEAREPSGVDALDWLEETITHSVLKSARFGTPAIYIGTLRGARGLSFRAVRIVGLVEGSVPSATREDPVLPDAARTALSPFLLSSRERAHQQLAAFDDAVRTARERIAFSAPRVSVEGSVRQPAAVLLDVIRALLGSSVDLEKKLEEFSHAGRKQERRARELCPVSPSAALDRIAHGDLAMARAEKNVALSLDALRSIRDRSLPTAQDGLLGDAIPTAEIAGLSAERPISASRLFTLLTCPHQFLYEHVLGMHEPAGALRTHSLDTLLFGTWLHAIAEEFWQEHGAAMGARRAELSKYQQQLRQTASRRFDELLQTYPFANDLVANAEREALCDQLNKLLTLDWGDAEPKTFVAVERAFGYEAPCQLETDAGPLFVRGKIDKLDLDGTTLLIRDIKTGTGKPRRADELPDPKIDLQVAVYALVAKQLAKQWGTPEEVAVAYMYLRSGESDRSWRGSDYAKLEDAAREWLATAREILANGAFARTPNRDDCSYCAHKPVCASELARTEEVLRDLRVPRRFRRLKLEEGP